MVSIGRAIDKECVSYDAHGCCCSPIVRISVFEQNNNNNNNNNNRVTGIVTRSVRKNLEAVSVKHSIDSLQKTAKLGTSHIIRKVLQCGT